MRIFRVSMPVGGVEEAAVFYRTLLGQTGRRVSPGRHYFDISGVILALVDPRADGDQYQSRPNLEPIYIAVDDLQAYHSRAKSLGSLSKEIGDGGLPLGEIATRPWGERSFYVTDPWANPLCFVELSTVFTGEH